MIKHVGKHNQRRVAIVYRQIPDEGHMALVAYTDALPSMIHDETMKTLESEVGQNAKELADALFRNTMADGTNNLQALHKGGHLKKVPTNQVIVTPTATSTCRLDELNDLLSKIEAGGDAATKLAEMNTRSVPNQPREVGEPVATEITGVLTDADLAKQNEAQATRMEAEAKTLLAEAKRLKAEAKSLTSKNTTKAKNVGKEKSKA